MSCQKGITFIFIKNSYLGQYLQIKTPYVVSLLVHVPVGRTVSEKSITV